METERLGQLLLTIAMYAGAGYIFISFVMFVMRDVAPKLMSGQAAVKDVLPRLAVGSLIVLALLSFGPYYLGKAILYGWQQFRPLITEITEDISGDFYQITTGNTPPVVITVPEIPPTPIIAPEVVPTVPVVLPTPTLAPTATPFNIDTWTPDQPVPPPGG